MRARHELRDPVVSHVLAGGAPKSFAATHGVSAMWVCRTLWNAGVRRYFLTGEEWQHIRDRRSKLSR